MMQGAWPSAVFDAPLLRDLDAASRHALEAAGTIRDAAAGTRLYREGDDADTFFVVLVGRVALRSIVDPVISPTRPLRRAADKARPPRGGREDGRRRRSQKFQVTTSCM